MRLKATLAIVSGFAAVAMAQGPAPQAERARSDWRRIGNTSVVLPLPGVGTGPVERVWYQTDGKLTIATRSGRVLETADFESWRESRAALPAEARRQIQAGARLYAAARDLLRSDDNGVAWVNLTSHRGTSILGGEVNELAVSPTDPDDVVVATPTGVWRSLDGGSSWNGLNQRLPNLTVRRILRLPNGLTGARLAFDGDTAWEWLPGQRTGWLEGDATDLRAESALRAELSEPFGAPVTSVATAGTFWYAGSTDGRVWVSPDGGLTWRPSRFPDGASVARFSVDPRDPSIALVAVGRNVFRTLNGGLFWDDVTANLPDATVRGLAVDRANNALFAATDRGVFLTSIDLNAAGPANGWSRVEGNLPAARAWDVKLDAAGNQLYVAVEGYGLYATAAPHRRRALVPVSSADLAARAASPGALLSIFGEEIRAARSGGLGVPVLASSPGESQMQVPFAAQGTTLTLALESAAAKWNVSLPLEAASPSIFVDRDGTPMLLDGDSGVLLDAMTPARSGTRIQILATGLGRVRPDWPAGIEAPIENPPAVEAKVQVYLDRQPIEVTRATLAPGYIGFYLIEAMVPSIVNIGTAELSVEANGRESNRVRVYIQR